MTKFLFQSDSINAVELKPITIDIPLGVIKIVDEKIYYDFQTNNNESIIVGTEREEVLARIQRGFECQYNAYGKIKKEDVGALDYNILQAWKRLQKHIKI